MGKHDSQTKGVVNYTEVAEGVDEMREMLRVLVAGVMAEGFSEEQARAVVAGIIGIKAKAATDD